MGTRPSVSKRKKRLPAEKRQEVVLQVAAEVFLEKGFEATSLDDIISRSGGSRRTIYTQFGGKAGLFKALVTEVATRALAHMQEPTDMERSVEEALFCFADRLLSALFTPSVLDLSRLALADGSRFPELAKVYFASGPQTAGTSLAALLDVAKERGEISCSDTMIAASQFVGMLRDNLYIEVLLRLRPAPEQHEKEKLIRNAVEVFLYGIGKKK